MTRKARLSLILFVLVGSLFYSLLIGLDPELARTVGVGYIGVVLTIFVGNELWRKP